MASTIFQVVICAACGEREAAVFIRRSAPAGDPSGAGGKGDLALCEGCARSRGIIAEKGRLEIRFEELLAEGAAPAAGEAEPVLCSVCGTDLASFLRDGRLGCPACADAFALRLLDRVGRGMPPGEPTGARPLPRKQARSPHRSRPASLREELRDALAAEDYERAAELRDALAGPGRGRKGAGGSDAEAAPGLPPSPPPREFPFAFPAFASAPGPDDDVVLATAAAVYRNLEGIPFPGAPRGCAEDYRGLLLGKILSLPGWSGSAMRDLSPAARRTLSERAFAPRSYSSDPRSPLAASALEGVYALLGDEDHLRLRSRLPGLAPQRAARVALSAAEGLGADLAFASRAGIGWICSRARDCGAALSVSATLHLPALASAGLHQRLFRALLAQGFDVRGLYSEEEDSAGAVYEVTAEGRRAGPDAAAAVDAAAATAVAAERKARERVSAKGGEARLDLESRSLALAAGCRLLAQGEAARIVSALRLAALSGRLHGIGHRALGDLLERLGPGALALGAGLAEPPAGEGELCLRAAAARAAVAGARYAPEGIGRCSKA